MTYIYNMTKTVSKALRTIQKLVEECRNKGTTRLPTTYEMARSAGVSPSTIRKALKVLSQQGVIRTSPKVGTTINLNVSYIPEYRMESSSEPKWQYVVKRIEQEIIPALSSASTLLPSAKELSYQLGVTYKTLHKALKELLRVGRIQRFKKGYRLHSQFSVSGKKKLFFIWPGEVVTEFIKTRHIFYDLLHTLEMLCVYNNIALDFMTFDADGTIDNHEFAAKYNRPDEILGFIVLPRNANEHFPLYQLLYSTGKPVTILDEGTPDLKVPFLGSSKFRIFQIGMDPYPGSKCAFYLKDRGHKHIAYLSIWHDDTWSQIRLAGIRNVYDQLGKEYSVTPICTSAQNYLKNHKRQTTFIVHDNDKDPFHVGYISNRAVLNKPVEDLCRKALEYKEITAWITANDWIALNCIDFLKKRDIAVPGDISIMGFDDCFEAINYNLTSFNFNSHALMHSMFNFIMTSQRLNRFPKQSEVEVVDGYIAERRSVDRLNAG
jgi:DNA-binding LacI/PurR family transcriptional regulator/DNA-binding transcriptional regulator YhcF (GntR family)